MSKRTLNLQVNPDGSRTMTERSRHVTLNPNGFTHVQNTRSHFQSQIDELKRKDDEFAARIESLYKFDSRTGERQLKKGADATVENIERQRRLIREQADSVAAMFGIRFHEAQQLDAEREQEIATEVQALDETRDRFGNRKLDVVNSIRARVGAAPVTSATGLSIKPDESDE